MKSRERVLKVLDQADRVPVIMCGIHAGIIDASPRMVDRIQQIIEPDEQVLRKLEVDFRFIYPKPPRNWRPIEYPDDSFRDEGLDGALLLVEHCNGFTRRRVAHSPSPNSSVLPHKKNMADSRRYVRRAVAHSG